MYLSTPIHPLLCKASLVIALTLLNYRHREYALRLLSLSDQHSTKEILPISLQNRDRDSEPGELSKNTLMYTKNARPTFYGRWLAWQIGFEHAVNPADQVKPVKIREIDRFSEKIVIQPKRECSNRSKKVLSRSSYVDRYIKTGS